MALSVRLEISFYSFLQWPKKTQMGFHNASVNRLGLPLVLLGQECPLFNSRCILSCVSRHITLWENLACCSHHWFRQDNPSTLHQQLHLWLGVSHRKCDAWVHHPCWCIFDSQWPGRICATSSSNNKLLRRYHAKELVIVSKLHKSHKISVVASQTPPSLRLIY